MPVFTGSFESIVDDRIRITAVGEYHRIPNLLQRWQYDQTVGYYTADYDLFELPNTDLHQRTGEVEMDIYGGIVDIKLQ